MAQKFYFTFGCGIDDPHRNCFTVIEAEDYAEARDEMFKKYGNKWSMCYSEEEWILDKESDPGFEDICRWHGLDPNNGPYTQQQMFHLTEI